MDTMKSAVEELLKLVEMKVRIENLRKIRNEGIAITCTSKEEIQKIVTEVKAKMGNEYVVKIPQLKNPKLRVYEIEEGIDDLELVTAIQNQNPQIIKADSEI
ncbi:hypothetical protein R5R35_004622 [Gryllus longicercus]|uniref:Uncharacterized protein n=1 Tax=Gryllus longicercus TaxID=2509291 RepID=A0AAN9ZA28_9ORTH